MAIRCTVNETEIENDNGYLIAGICVTCSRCDHEVEVYGTSGASVRRGLVMLREECPFEEGNFYVADAEGE